MSRHRRGGWAGGMWPFMMYGQQPAGWSEQTMGMGFGQRPGRANNSYPAWLNDHTSCSGQSLSLEALGNLFTRLILQSHLTRLAGDSLGLGGRGLWGCSAPAPSSSQQHTCSVPSPTSSSNCQHGRQSSGCGGINVCGHTNNINVCHTCPAATRPYMGTNNVFVIPATHVQQQLGGGAGLGCLGNFDSLHHNNLNMFLNGLGLAMGLNNGCGGVPTAWPGGFPLNDLGGGIGEPAMNSGSSFSCRACNFQV